MNILDQAHKAAYEAALLTDNIWSDELHRVYGLNAGDARYDKRGVATPLLSKLKDAKINADNAWRILSRLCTDRIAA